MDDILSSDHIVLKIIGALLVWFFARLVKQVDDAIKEMRGLSQNMIVVNSTLNNMKEEGTIRHQNTQTVLSEHHEEIELVRFRSHWIINKLTELKLKAEIAGWKFSGADWEMPAFDSKLKKPDL